MTQPRVVQEAERIAADRQFNWNSPGRDTTGEHEIPFRSDAAGNLETPFDAKTAGERLVVLQRLIEEVKDQLDELPVTYAAQVYDLGARHVSLKAPILVVVERSEGEVFVRFPELELTGVGESEPQAFQDFREAFVELYEDLKSSPKGTLGPLPLRWLKVITQLVHSNG